MGELSVKLFLPIHYMSVSPPPPQGRGVGVLLRQRCRVGNSQTEGKIRASPLCGRGPASRRRYTNKRNLQQHVGPKLCLCGEERLTHAHSSFTFRVCFCLPSETCRIPLKTPVLFLRILVQTCGHRSSRPKHHNIFVFILFNACIDYSFLLLFLS